MKIHLAWSLADAPSVYPGEPAFSAYLTPDRASIVHIAPTSAQGGSPYRRHEEALNTFLEETGLSLEDLCVVVGRVHVPSAEPWSAELRDQVWQLLLLGEEPAGNDAVEELPPVPRETFLVLCHGSAWPGYGKLSIEPDGDLLVEHVLMGSVAPPSPEP